MPIYQADISTRDTLQHYVDNAPEIQNSIADSSQNIQVSEDLPLLHEYLANSNIPNTQETGQIRVQAPKRKNQIVTQREREKLKME